jgi:hypothetical protein
MSDMRRVVFTLWLLNICLAKSQTFQQWAQVVHWDGVSSWKRYIIIQPAYMGPNALPVPQLSNGSVKNVSSVALTGTIHFSRGDNTQNLNLYANYCLVKDRISFDLSWVPYEHYMMDQQTKEERHVFSHYFYDTKATGDVVLNTNIQLFNKWRKYFQSALRIGYRFPTSSGLGTARYSDAPGYSFDFSFSKILQNSSLQPECMLGFYSWQLQSDRHQQDDAFVFGAGMSWQKNKWKLRTNICGYLGYQENSGDKPIVARFECEKKFAKTAFLLHFQQGLHDYRYTSIEAGGRYFFGN